MDSDLKDVLRQGTACYRKGDYNGARLHFETLFRRGVWYADVCNMLGVSYHAAGLFAKSQEAFEKALELNPNYTEAAFNLAVVYNDLGNYAAARDVYERAKAICDKQPGRQDPAVLGKIANLHVDLARAYRSLGSIEPAVAEYRKALHLCPAFVDVKTELGSALCEAGRFDEALVILGECVAEFPEAPLPRIQLGLCYFTRGEHTKAVHQWLLVLEHSPDDARARMYLRLVKPMIDTTDTAVRR